MAGRTTTETCSTAFWSILAFLPRPYVTLVVFGGTSLLLAGLELAVAPLMRLGINSLVSYDSTTFVAAVSGVIILIVAQAVSYGWLQAYLVECEAKIAAKIRQKLAHHLLAAPLHIAQRVQPGEFGSRFTSDINAASELLKPTFALVNTSLVALGAAVYMLVLDWRIGLATLIAIIVTTKTGEVLSRPISDLAERVQESYARLSAFSQQSLANVAVVKVFSLEGLLEKTFAKLNIAAAKLGALLCRRNAALEAAVWWWAAVPLFIPLGYGGYLMLKGALDPGTVFAILYLSNFTRAPVAELGSTLGEIRKALGSAQEILRLLSSLGKREPTSGVALSPASGLDTEAVWLQRVTFRYPDSPVPVLEDVTVSLPSGQVTFVVGKSGTGKSTLFKVLAGLYPPTSGVVQVLSKNPDCAEPNMAVPVVYVPQEPFLFPWTILENLALVHPNPRLEDVQTALEVACAEFVWELPHGLDTTLSESGAPLSGGQRTRLCIARALLANPTVLLLDEPGANLDAITEEELLRRLRQFMHGKTLGIITHRLGLIQNQDWVIVVDDRQVVAQGYHGELLQTSPLYAAMYRGFMDSGDCR